ncbi:MAG TPA: hypothetical protein VFE42_19180 [Chloroflexota bacterium]|nr:hypothetical protein [Chloroflexota bacterium]HZS89600.1 hypothetical protein [Chloroflexota bacterium]
MMDQPGTMETINVQLRNLGPEELRQLADGGWRGFDQARQNPDVLIFARLRPLAVLAPEPPPAAPAADQGGPRESA